MGTGYKRKLFIPSSHLPFAYSFFASANIMVLKTDTSIKIQDIEIGKLKITLKESGDMFTAVERNL